MFKYFCEKFYSADAGKTIFVLTMAAELDKIDLQILRTLQENGRITNLQLSNEIGLSPAPTLERVRKLENAEYIKSYHARPKNHRKILQ